MRLFNKVRKLKYGDVYISSLSEGLNAIENISSFRMDDNRMSKLSADIFLKNLNLSLLELNLSKNAIGLTGC